MELGDLITVIIPVYNVEPYIDRCMKSVLNQTYRDLEIIVVDDKSTDRSRELCSGYTSDPRVSVIFHEENKGLSGARNSGLSAAHGQYVVFIDSDDYIEASMIENLHTCLIQTNADTVVGGFKNIIGSRVETRENKLAGIVFDTQEDIINKVLKRMLASDGVDSIEMSVWKVLFSMDIIRSHNLRFPDRKYLCEDIIFDFDYYPLAQKVAMCADTGYCYCLNEASLSQMYQEKKEERIAFQAAEMAIRAKALNLDENAFARIDNFYVGNLIHHIKVMAANVKRIGKEKCLNSCIAICRSEDVRKMNWSRIARCYQGRDKIPFILFKNNKPRLLFCYMRLLTGVRSLLRRH